MRKINLGSFPWKWVVMLREYLLVLLGVSKLLVILLRQSLVKISAWTPNMAMSTPAPPTWAL